MSSSSDGSSTVTVLPIFRGHHFDVGKRLVASLDQRFRDLEAQADSILGSVRPFAVRSHLKREVVSGLISRIPTHLDSDTIDLAGSDDMRRDFAAKLSQVFFIGGFHTRKMV